MTRSQAFTPSLGRWILIGTILPSSMAFIDSTALNVALPAIQQDLGMDATSLLWVVNGYAIFLAALLLAGGALGDTLGRKRIFMIGISVFTVASVLCGISTSSAMLIAMRCLQGIGGALMAPGSLAIISASFPEDQRGKAIGTWSMFSTVTTVFGPILGGWLAGKGLWHWIFFINVPLGIISLIILQRFVPESRNEEADGVDYAGTLSVTLGLGALTFGFIEVAEHSWTDPLILGSFIVGILSLIAFVQIERRVKNPLVPLKLFQSSTFSGANLMTFTLYFALGGLLFFFPLNLIQIQGYPAELAGMTMLPFAVLMAILARLSGQWVDKRGYRGPMIVGPILTAGAFMLYAAPGITGGPADFWTSYFPAILVMGIGMGITVVPLTTAVMGCVSDQYAGAASGINNTVARAASVLAIAMMGALMLLNFRQVFMTSLEDLQLSADVMQQLEIASLKLADTRPPDSLPADQQAQILERVKLAFISAFRTTGWVCAGLSLLSAGISFWLIERNPQKVS
ncbi:MFS transporter [Pontibacter sp. G13]|uniref:MFS transporter n=1 Tax=Pontibacter sp. G13 TaxID=3074898 RepID=UPI00288B9619|nr:MFS transporter [Pontibacter sp. G13]WNJ16720.1 MFS transporter [Pontibacter sp. G13]